MKSKEQKRQEALARNLQSIEIWHELAQQGFAWLEKLELSRVAEIQRKFSARKKKEQTFAEFCLVAAKNVERDVRNLQAKRVTVSGY